MTVTVEHMDTTRAKAVAARVCKILCSNGWEVTGDTPAAGTSPWCRRLELRGNQATVQIIGYGSCTVLVTFATYAGIRLGSYDAHVPYLLDRGMSVKKTARFIHDTAMISVLSTYAAALDAYTLTPKREVEL